MVLRFMLKLLESDKGGGGGSTGTATADPPASGSTSNQGGGNGSTPPSGGDNADKGTTPPDNKGAANDQGEGGKTRPKNIFAGIHPQRLKAIRARVLEEEGQTLRDSMEAEAAKKAGEWQKVAEKAEGELERLKARNKELEERMETSDELVNTYLESRVKDWPKEWLDGDPRKRNPEAPLHEVIAWMDWAEPLIAKQKNTPADPGNNPNPPAAGTAPGTLTPEQQAAYEAKVREQRGLDI